jgi:hypothetical protein
VSHPSPHNPSYIEVIRVLSFLTNCPHLLPFDICTNHGIQFPISGIPIAPIAMMPLNLSRFCLLTNGEAGVFIDFERILAHTFMRKIPSLTDWPLTGPLP